ncbi:hypothetical protein J6590_045709 [Homalodisca vitripennis]|nr:hypothetical protein J6590_045709 [Homalodisca vitripennis]
MKDIQTKIQNLSLEENFNHETSLTLAAEIGTALLSKNNTLKQKIQDIQSSKSLHELELEDTLENTKSIIKDQLEENNQLKSEITFMTKKLENEKKIRDDFIRQAEDERTNFTDQLNNLILLNTQLRDRFDQIDATLKKKGYENESLKNENEKLVISNAELKNELERVNEVANKAKWENEKTLVKLKEQEIAAKAFLKVFITNTSQSPSNAQQARKPTPNNHFEEKSENINWDIHNGQPRSQELPRSSNSPPPKIRQYKRTIPSSIPQIVKSKKSPPLNAKIKERDESYDDFFLNNINFYREHMKQHYNFRENRELLPANESTSEPSNQLQQTNFLDNAKTIKTKMKTKETLNSSETH